MQDSGLFDAPDAAVSLTVKCTDPLVAVITVRNLGLVGLPAGVEAALYRLDMGNEVELTTVMTTQALLPGQSEVFEYPLAMDQGTSDDLYLARILIDPDNPTFNECKDDNNETPPTDVLCVG
ncbi:MAG: hypothetical protein H6713_15415 [Myxococcales bacterium]|nr:hypothetical protein [Myxococcales bacterium]